MKKRNWILVGAAAAAYISGAVACGQSSGGVGGGGASAGTGAASASSSEAQSTASSASVSVSVGVTTTGSTTSSTGSGGTCSGKLQSDLKLHPPPADAGPATVYCPFSDPGDAGNAYCDPATEHCCEPNPGLAGCSGSLTACVVPPDGGTMMDWGCQDSLLDCTGGKLCCATTGVMVINTETDGSGAQCANYGAQFTQTLCVDPVVGTGGCPHTAKDLNQNPIAAAEMCVTDTTCANSPAGHTCIPFTTKGAQVGACGTVSP